MQTDAPANAQATAVRIPAQAADAVPAAPVQPIRALSLVALGSVLSACGGGGSAGGLTGGGPAPTVKQASRFLAQAAIGPTAADLTSVQQLGVAGWLDQQFAMPASGSVWDWMVAKGYDAAANINGTQNIDAAMWRSLIVAPDTLRQRVALALSEILVVGVDGLNVSWRGFAAAGWFDLLCTHAFGNYRALLQAMSTSPAMGVYLTFRGNAKANATTGAQPDENYARELMQLFTIGLYRLAADGTPTLSGGKPVETYTQDDIQGLARVFTGWDFDSADTTTPARMRRPMIQVASRHETGAKTFLGTTIPAGTDGARSLTLALDAIFAHPNVAPFVCRQLIQRLITSNPTAAYVGRVAAVFANDGTGTRGNLQAVVRAILLDADARATPDATNLSAGKLREPMLRLTAWARFFAANSATDDWTIGNTSDPSTRLGQSPMRSPSVFNFQRPGYVPPASAIAAAGLVAPEFQLVNESTVVGYVNYLQTVIASGAGSVKADYTDWIPLAGDPATLVARLNEQFAGGHLSAATVATIVAAVGTIAAGTPTGPLNRVLASVLLVMASPEYLVQK